MGAELGFDPYHKWLGISKRYLPANHYRLLGIELFEEDEDVIESSADARMAHVRTFAHGAHTQLSQKILNELAQARVALLDATKKAAYDAQLRRQIEKEAQALAAKSEAERAAAQAEIEQEELRAAEEAAAYSQSPAFEAASFGQVGSNQVGQFGGVSTGRPVAAGSLRTAGSKLSAKGKKAGPPMGLLIGGGAGALALLLVIVMMSSGGSNADDKNKQTAATTPETKPAPPAKPTPQPINTPVVPAVKPTPLPSVTPPVTKPPIDKPPVDKTDEQPTSIPQPKPTDKPEDPLGPSTPKPETPKVAVGPQPLPTAAQLDALVRTFAGSQKARMDAAALPADKTALARAWIDQAITTENSDTRAAMLESARRFAVRQGDLPTAVHAIDVMLRWYTFDRPTLYRASVNEAATKVSTPEGRASVATALFEQVETELAAEQYESAKTIAQQALSLAEGSANPAVQKFARLRSAAVTAIHKQYQDIAPAIETLKKDPKDKPANTAVGRFYALVREDWKRGLPMLAAGDDDVLKLAADMELGLSASGFPTVEEQLKIADKWWGMGTTAKVSTMERDAIKSHAVDLYQAVEPSLTGANKTRVEKLIAVYSGSSASKTVASVGVVDIKKFPKLTGLDTRKPPYRAALVAAYGGNEKTEAAVASALGWLAKHQNRDGSWSFNFQAVGDCKAQCSDPGKLENAGGAATAVSLLALLGSGNTSSSGSYSSNVKAGLKALGDRANAIAGKGASLQDADTGMYGHARGAMVFSEATAMGDRSMAAPTQLLLSYTVSEQSTRTGGWRDSASGADDRGGPPGIPDFLRGRGKGRDRFRPGGGGNFEDLETLNFAWQMNSLQMGSFARITIPTETVRLSQQFLTGVQYDGGAAYYERYNPRDKQGEGQSYLATAAGLLSRMYLGATHDTPSLGRGVEILVTEGPHPRDMYYNYFATQVVFHFGGEAWNRWNAKMIPILISTQATAGHETGSWSFRRRYGDQEYGRLMDTALAALILETYYRQAPLYGDTSAAVRASSASSTPATKPAPEAGAATTLLSPTPALATP